MKRLFYILVGLIVFAAIAMFVLFPAGTAKVIRFRLASRHNLQEHANALCKYARTHNGCVPNRIDELFVWSFFDVQ